jgi:hypothetical protein
MVSKFWASNAIPSFTSFFIKDSIFGRCETQWCASQDEWLASTLWDYNKVFYIMPLHLLGCIPIRILGFSYIIWPNYPLGRNEGGGRGGGTPSANGTPQLWSASVINRNFVHVCVLGHVDSLLLGPISLNLFVMGTFSYPDSSWSFHHTSFPSVAQSLI